MKVFAARRVLIHGIFMPVHPCPVAVLNVVLLHTFQSGGRLGGSLWGRPEAERAEDVDAAHDEGGKDSWLDIARDIASRIETPGITWNLKPEKTHLKFRKVCEHLRMHGAHYLRALA